MAKRIFTKYPSSYVKASVTIGDLELGAAVKTTQGNIMYVTRILNDDWVWVTDRGDKRYDSNAEGWSLPVTQIKKVFKR